MRWLTKKEQAKRAADELRGEDPDKQVPEEMWWLYGANKTTENEVKAIRVMFRLELEKYDQFLQRDLQTKMVLTIVLVSSSLLTAVIALLVLLWAK